MSQAQHCKEGGSQDLCWRWGMSGCLQQGEEKTGKCSCSSASCSTQQPWHYWVFSHLRLSTSYVTTSIPRGNCFPSSEKLVAWGQISSSSRKGHWVASRKKNRTAITQVTFLQHTEKIQIYRTTVLMLSVGVSLADKHLLALKILLISHTKIRDISTFLCYWIVKQNTNFSLWKSENGPQKKRKLHEWEGNSARSP